MMSVRCLRSVASLTTARSLRSRTWTRLGRSWRCAHSCATRSRAMRNCLPSLPWAILKPRMVGRRCSALLAAAAPFAFEPGEVGTRRLDLLIQSAALGIGDSAGRILRLDLVIDECIEQELFSHVLE